MSSVIGLLKNELLEFYYEYRLLKRVLCKYKNQMKSTFLYRCLNRISHKAKKIILITQFTPLNNLQSLAPQGIQITFKPAKPINVMKICLNQLNTEIIDAAELTSQLISKVHFIYYYLFIFAILSRLHYQIKKILSYL